MANLEKPAQDIEDDDWPYGKLLEQEDQVTNAFKEVVMTIEALRCYHIKFIFSPTWAKILTRIDHLLAATMNTLLGHFCANELPCSLRTMQWISRLASSKTPFYSFFHMHFFFIPLLFRFLFFCTIKQ